MQVKAMKKAALAALMSAVLVFSLGALAGCSPPTNDEELIREALASELDRLKSADEEDMAALVEAAEEGLSDSDVAQLESMGVTAQDIVKSMVEGFDYAITDVSVNGDTAIAEVSVTSKDFTDFTTGIAEAVSALLDDPEQIASLSEDEIMTVMGDKVKDTLANLPLSENTVDLDMKKTGGVWEPTAGAGAALGSVLFGA